MHNLTWEQLTLGFIIVIILGIVYLVYTYRAEKKLIKLEEEVERIDAVVKALAAIQKSEAMGEVYQELSEDQQPCTPQSYSDHLPITGRSGTGGQHNYRDQPGGILEDRCTYTLTDCTKNTELTTLDQSRDSYIKK